jgi:hypothetical protein
MLITMATAVRTKAKRQKETVTTVTEPKRLSKLGQWMRDNPKGFFEVLDWRAVDK